MTSGKKVPSCKIICAAKLNHQQLMAKISTIFWKEKKVEKAISSHGNFRLQSGSNTKKTPPLDTSETKTLKIPN